MYLSSQGFFNLVIAPWETLLTRLHASLQPVFTLFCSTGFKRQVHCWCPCVHHREGHLSVFVSTNNGQLPFRPMSLSTNALHMRNKSCLFQVVAGIVGCWAALRILLKKVNCWSMSTVPLHLINLVYCTDQCLAGCHGSEWTLMLTLLERLLSD